MCPLKTERWGGLPSLIGDECCIMRKYMNTVFIHVCFPYFSCLWACCELATERIQLPHGHDLHAFAFITSTAAANESQVVESGHLVFDGGRGVAEFG